MKIGLIKSRIAAMAALLVLSSGASAAGWSGWVEVGQLSARNDGSIWINLPQGVNPDACELGTWVIIESTHLGIDRLYSMLLTAKMGNREVAYYVDGCIARFPSVQYINLR